MMPTQALVVLLLACRAPEAPVDADGDGWVAGADCDDDDARSHPGAAELGDGVDRDCDGAAPPPDGNVLGGVTDGGAGSAVLQAGGISWVGAPWGRPEPGRWPAGGWIAQDRRGQETQGVGSPGDALGAAFAALDDGTVLVGAPGVGEVRSALSGDVVLRLPGAGGRLASRGGVWVTRTSRGVARVDARGDVELPTPARAEALLVWDADTTIVGMPTGDVAVLVLLADGTSHAVARSPTPVGAYPDEAGWALASCDLDADGARELVIGAPGAGRVLALTDLRATSLEGATIVATGAGRFGAALACDGDALWVGAPMYGPDVGGAVLAVRRGAMTMVQTGTSRDDQLGFALAFGDDSLLVGAPGASGTPGKGLRRVP